MVVIPESSRRKLRADADRRLSLMDFIELLSGKLAQPLMWPRAAFIGQTGGGVDGGVRVYSWRWPAELRDRQGDRHDGHRLDEWSGRWTIRGPKPTDEATATRAAPAILGASA